MKAEHRIKASSAAEHRKELHTNALADRMGRFMQSVRQRPRGKTVLIWVVVVVLVVGFFVWTSISRTRSNVNSELWMYLYEGTSKAIETLTTSDYKTTKQGEVAHVQRDWMFLWDNSWAGDVKTTNPKTKKPAMKKVQVLCGIMNLKTLGKQYNAKEVIEGQKQLFLLLEEDYKDMAEKLKADPVLGSETLYDLGVIQETLAVYDVKYLDTAKLTFQKVRDDFKDTGAGIMAEQRLKQSYDTLTKLNDLRDFYQKFGVKGQFDKQGEEEAD